MSIGSQGNANGGARLADAIADLFLPDAARLGEQLRARVAALLAAAVAAIDADLRRRAGRLLAARGLPDAAEALLRAPAEPFARLSAAGLLREPALMAELIGQAKLEALEAALPLVSASGDAPSLLIRLAAVPDRQVAAAARALLAAYAGRDEAAEPGSAPALAAEPRHRLTWQVAAALRPSPEHAEIDRALAAAAERSLAGHDEDARVATAAARLAAAIDARPDEAPALLEEALADRRLALFVAVLARALGIDDDLVQALVIEPDDERLWPALRAAGLGRAAMARVAVVLAEADGRRALDPIAELLDRVAALTPVEALATLAPLALPRDLRAAAAALAA